MFHLCSVQLQLDLDRVAEIEALSQANGFLDRQEPAAGLLREQRGLLAALADLHGDFHRAETAPLAVLEPPHQLVRGDGIGHVARERDPADVLVAFLDDGLLQRAGEAEGFGHGALPCLKPSRHPELGSGSIAPHSRSTPVGRDLAAPWRGVASSRWLRACGEMDPETSSG